MEPIVVHPSYAFSRLSAYVNASGLELRPIERFREYRFPISIAVKESAARQTAASERIARSSRTAVGYFRREIYK